jgi:hypothetical protein
MTSRSHIAGKSRASKLGLLLELEIKLEPQKVGGPIEQSRGSK